MTERQSGRHLFAADVADVRIKLAIHSAERAMAKRTTSMAVDVDPVSPRSPRGKPGMAAERAVLSKLIKLERERYLIENKLVHLRALQATRVS